MTDSTEGGRKEVNHLVSKTGFTHLGGRSRVGGVGVVSSVETVQGEVSVPVVDSTTQEEDEPIDCQRCCALGPFVSGSFDFPGIFGKSSRWVKCLSLSLSHGDSRYQSITVAVQSIRCYVPSTPLFLEIVSDQDLKLNSVTSVTLHKINRRLMDSRSGLRSRPDDILKPVYRKERLDVTKEDLVLS